MITIIVFILGSLCVTSAAPSITVSDVIDKTASEGETSLNAADFSNSPKQEVDLREIGIAVPDDPTLGTKTEGDIAINNIKRFMDDQPLFSRNVVRQSYRRWPNNEIPYTLSTQYGAYSRSIIAKAMNEYHTKTCIRFVPRNEAIHNDYVYIHPDDGCYSLVGRTGGRQPLSLDSGCIQTGTIVHELMHTVGFFHEQSRYDRDDFIEIAWPNVIKGADDQFEKYGMNVINQMNEPYDYSSIMHYGPYAFSANGKRTIVARKPGAGKMGQRVQFSEIDLRKINKLYNCNMSGSSTPLPTTNGTSTPDNNNNAVNKDCLDLNWRCSFWSMTIFGYCNEYAEVRDTVCRRSCGSCYDPPPPPMVEAVCEDSSPLCKHIKKSSCSTPLTQVTCQKTCNMCKSSVCEDKSEWTVCQSVVLLQLCPERTDCNRSCGLCGS